MVYIYIYGIYIYGIYINIYTYMVYIYGVYIYMVYIYIYGIYTWYIYIYIFGLTILITYCEDQEDLLRCLGPWLELLQLGHYLEEAPGRGMER